MTGCKREAAVLDFDGTCCGWREALICEDPDIRALARRPLRVACWSMNFQVAAYPVQGGNRVPHIRALRPETLEKRGRSCARRALFLVAVTPNRRSIVSRQALRGVLTRSCEVRHCKGQELAALLCHCR